MHNYDIGRLKISLEFRDLETDRGLSIHVFGPVDGSIEEILRFDCFENKPHYHTAFSYRKNPLVPIVHADPFGWAIEKLRTDLKELLRDASAEEIDRSELANWDTSLDKVETTGRQIVADV